MTAGIIKRALEECELSEYHYRLGAVVFKGKRIISSGHNSIRSSSIHNKYKKFENADASTDIKTEAESKEETVTWFDGKNRHKIDGVELAIRMLKNR